MKTLKLICLSVLMLVGTVLGVRGEAARTNINPALLYYQAFIVAPEPISAEDWKYLESKKGREQKLPDRFGPIVAATDNQFRLVRQAAHAALPCDWGIDLSVGPNSLLPHLGRAKAIANTSQLRVAWALQHGHQAEARDDLLATFVMGRHAGSDALLISALVQNIIGNINCNTVAQHFGEFTPETLQQLVAGFDAAPVSVTMAECIVSEKRLGDWMLTQLLELRKAYPDDDAKVMAGFHDSGIVSAMTTVGHTNFWPQLIAASGGTSEGVLKLLHETEPLFPRLAEVLALPPAEYEMQSKQFSAEMQASKNPFFISFDLFKGWHLTQQQLRPRPREFRAQAQLAMVHAAVEYKLHGESGLKSVQDPFGKGPFSFQRFVFKGVDRGFELKSAYAGSDAPFAMIFVEKQGAAFYVTGPEAGKAIAP
jgi:hypothetical protein